MKFSVVTSFSQVGYNDYASKMIDTFLATWPETIDLWVYAEDCEVRQQHPRLHVIDYHREVPALVAFKERWKNDPKARGWVDDSRKKVDDKSKRQGFRWDAIRFSHKVYAVCDAARRLGGTVIWMDADMVCHTPIPLAFIKSQIDPAAGVSFFGRQKKFSECGLYALNMSILATQTFVQWFQEAYDNAEQGIFTMEEWNDCWVFDRIRERIQATYPDWQQQNWGLATMQGEGHPIINSPWGAYLDHLKGERKARGASQQKDLKIQRTESYWQSIT